MKIILRNTALIIKIDAYSVQVKCAINYRFYYALYLNNTKIMTLSIRKNKCANEKKGMHASFAGCVAINQ